MVRSPQASSPSQSLRASSPKGGALGITVQFSVSPEPLPLGEVDLQSKDGEGEDANPSAALSQKAALQLPFSTTSPLVKMRLERSAELVGAKPLHLLTQNKIRIPQNMPKA